VQYLPTHEKIADIFTKPLAKTKFEYFRDRIVLVENASLAERECDDCIIVRHPPGYVLLCDLVESTYERA
jgi:hypothetical protein